MSWWPFRRRVPPLAHWQIIFYTRSGCHLCDDAWEQLRQWQRRYGFALTQVDVDSDPALAREHGSQVPVVRINGKVRFRGAVDPVLFNRLITAEGGRRGGPDQGADSSSGFADSPI